MAQSAIQQLRSHEEVVKKETSIMLPLQIQEMSSQLNIAHMLSHQRLLGKMKSQPLRAGMTIPVEPNSRRAAAAARLSLTVIRYASTQADACRIIGIRSRAGAGVRHKDDHVPAIPRAGHGQNLNPAATATGSGRHRHGRSREKRPLCAAVPSQVSLTREPQPVHGVCLPGPHNTAGDAAGVTPGPAPLTD